jgi:hypothetical protein
MSEESELNHFESLLEIQPHLVGAGLPISSCKAIKLKRVDLVSFFLYRWKIGSITLPLR